MNTDTQTRPEIPEISDDELKKRMSQIKYVSHYIVATDGKPYQTDEKNPSFFSLFYVESGVDPRTQAFNFDKNKKVYEEASDLEVIGKSQIFVKIGGYYGFCKITMAEVMSQVPEDFLNKAVAFSLDQNSDPQILDSDYQSTIIVFYGKSDKETDDNDFPAFEGLIKEVGPERAKRLAGNIHPMIKFVNQPYSLIETSDVLSEPYLKYGIWLRINGSNLHDCNSREHIKSDCEVSDSIEVFQEINPEEGADFLSLNYEHVISQIPDDMIKEKTIGFCFTNADYFKTDKGIVHKIKIDMISEK